ncbi:MAG: sigma-54-dependent transcriptional regulator [Candidatus Hydrogenedentota bacterium]
MNEMPEEEHVIAVVDDEPAQRALLTNTLERAGYAVRPCADGDTALDVAPDVDLMLLDVRMPGMSGLDVLARLRKDRPELPVILLTAYIDVRDAVQAIKQGALDYLEKPLDLDELVAAIDDALGVTGRRVGTDLPGLPAGIVAESEAMREVFRQAARVAETDTTVLVLGPSGVGKEVVAQFIHQHSARSARPLVAVDCTSLPENLAESELFGHEKGAFTGADSARPGRFEEADGSTMFLDEIGELPLALQPKLLRVLETGAFRRVGGRAERGVDVRVVAATNRDLEVEVREGRFREDLYYRLNVFPIAVPPLRERPEDVLALAEKFLRVQRKRLAPAAQRVVAAYAWPGNVRELRNAMERAAILANGTVVLPADLPPNLREPVAKPEAGGVLVGDMQEIQRRAILEALEKTGGNKTQASELLGISRRNLVYKLRAYGL